MKKILSNTTSQLFLLITIASALIYSKYQILFENLTTNKTIDIYRDGIKTILNAIYHAKYDESYTWYEGMNYPYQEHIVAATELPGIAILFKFLYPYFPWITDYAFGIIHLMLLFSILLCAIFIYLIFKELKTPYYLAIPFTIAITFLAPQNMRFSVHMGLAPLFVLPSILYFLLKYELTQKRKHLFLLALFTFIGAFLHFYFFAIIAIFVSLYYFVAVLNDLNLKNIKKLLLNYSIAIGIPLLFFLFYMILNDKITDRTPNPYGFFVYNSNFTNLFSSPHLPLFTWINDDWFDGKEVDFEGWSYIGLIADVFLIILLSKWLFSKFRTNIFSFIPREFRPFLTRLLIAGGIMAYLSCSQPFIMKGWEFLLEYTGPYKQFRSTGRFAWAFYFSINVIAFTGFYYLFISLKNKLLKVSLFLLIIGISLYEAYTFHSSPKVFRPYHLKAAPELVSGQEFTNVTDIDFSEYQAIVPIPLFLVGSNNIELSGGAYIVQQALVLSTQTGLPITGAMLTRSSHRQSFDQLQLVTEPYRKPTIFDDYKNNKPLLLLVSHTNNEEDELKYGHLKDGSELLHQTEKWSLYEMELSDFKKRIEKKVEAIKSEINDNGLYSIDGFLSTDSINNFIYQNFDSLTADNPYLGKGHYKGHVGQTNYLFIGHLPNANPDSNYTLQVWVDVIPDRFATATLKVSEKLANGHVNIVGQTTPGWGSKVFDTNGWVSVEIPFRISSPESEIRVTLKKHEDYDRREISVDELLIKPLGTDLYKMSDGFIWKNNRFYQTN